MELLPRYKSSEWKEVNGWKATKEDKPSGPGFREGVREVKAGPVKWGALASRCAMMGSIFRQVDLEILRTFRWQCWGGAGCTGLELSSAKDGVLHLEVTGN